MPRPAKKAICPQARGFGDASSFGDVEYGGRIDYTNLKRCAGTRSC